MSYKIQLDNFEGPLDLLLFLIKKNDIDVCNIPIATITDQYMEYISTMQLLNLEIVGDFLVMAATLMQIKSKMLLPPDPLANAGEEADPRSELVRRLQEYQLFKQVADTLKDKESFRQDLFSRLVDEEALNQIKEDSQEVFIEASLFDLINALNSAIAKVPEKRTYQVNEDEFTVGGQMHSILHLLIESPKFSLKQLFYRASCKTEIICTFVAVLELIKQKEIIAFQRRAFDDIEVVRNFSNETVADQNKGEAI
ncbi:MAG: segregation/condensation protein A [Candidatus Omnitrophica bacterium]|nr:segregation/condensation protein A [Candidatus Omnitrophota bacterium]